MAQTNEIVGNVERRNRHIAQKMGESVNKSHKILNLRKEVKHLKRHIASLKISFEHSSHFDRDLINAGETLLLRLTLDRIVRYTPKEVIDGIEIYDLEDVARSFGFTLEDRKINSISYDELQIMCGALIKHKNLYYYAAEKEEFSEYQAVNLAKREGKTGVIVENLS